MSAFTALELDAAVFKDARKNAYFNPQGRDVPLRSPIPQAVVDEARRYRAGRLRALLAQHDCGAILLYDPVNIRYAVDSTHMPVWMMRNPSRYALVFADGRSIMFECWGCDHLNDDVPVGEVRPAVSWTNFSDGRLAGQSVLRWADEIAATLAEFGAGTRLAVDTLDMMGVHALTERGVTLVEGQPITEQARSIKGSAEVTLMRWTIRVCEAAMARMYEASEPGRTEREIWAELHFENARSGGEWLETKLVTAGARTNPWFRECSDYAIKRGEMIAFDTDMVGPYGYCADLSRSWTCGHTKMTPRQARLYATALEQIEHNVALLRPGLSFREFNERSWAIPEAHLAYRYPGAVHGIGMVDEWPLVPLRPDFPADFTGGFEENMVVAVESLIAEAGSESVKLETQVLVTASGPQRLDSFPWERG